jgi:hypothetical protein
MIDSHVVVAKVDNGNVSITERHITAKSLDGVGDPVARTIEPNPTFIQKDGLSTLRFIASKIGGRAINIADGTDSVVVAAGSSNEFAFHQKYGVGTVDWQSGQVQKQHPKAVLWLHVFAMAIAWAWLLPLGISVAVFGKEVKPEGWWFRMHLRLQWSGVCVMVLGYVCALINVGFESGISVHFNSPHKVIGHLVVLTAILQPLNGLLRPDKNAGARRTVWEALHKNAGRISGIAALVNLILGLVLAKDYVSALLGVAINLVAVGVLLVAASIFRVRRDAAASDSLLSEVTPAYTKA